MNDDHEDSSNPPQVFISPSELIDYYNSGRLLSVSMREKTIKPNIVGTSKSFLFNDQSDTIFQNNNIFRNKNVLTAFTKQWVGIRQACGALPGHKLAVDANHRFSAIEIGEIAEKIKHMQIEQIVYHGMASSTNSLIRGLKQLIPSVSIYGVWHGTMAGWSSVDEVRLFADFLALADDRIYERVAFLRQGMQHLHKYAFESILYNIPPKYDVERFDGPFEHKPIKCIFPSWNNSWKNMYTNVLAAERSEFIEEIYLYSKPSLDIFEKVRFVEFQGHENHLLRLAKLDLCLNVSINDCQPMAELEGISVGTPSLRNDWNLCLDFDSAYEQHFTVRSYLNANALIEKIRDISMLESEYISSIIDQHKQGLLRSSRERYDLLLSK